ncbi:hypothetical protein D3C75_467410 [compost metagenome]
MEEFQVSARNDQITNKLYNRINYSYIGNYTGETLADYPGAIPESYRYGSTATVQSETGSNGKQTTYTFDGKGRLLSTDTFASNGDWQVEKNSAFDSIFIYSPTRTTLFKYGANDTEATADQSVMETNYTDWGEVSSQTSLLPIDKFNDVNLRQHYTTSNTYEPAFHQPKSKSWYQKENDASPFSEHYSYIENGRLAEVTDSNQDKTTYTYNYIDGLGNIDQITAETRSGNRLSAKSISRYGSENG